MKRMYVDNHTVAVHCLRCGEWTLDIEDGVCMACTFGKVDKSQLTSDGRRLCELLLKAERILLKTEIRTKFCPDCNKQVIPRFISNPPDGWEESCPECEYIWSED